jgi:hypothetical protein
MAVKKLSRPDNSGGWIVMKYTNGAYTHRMKQHVDKWQNGDNTLTYSTPNGTELTVLDTFHNLASLLIPFYDAAWSYSLESVYQNIGPDPDNAGYHLFVEEFGWAIPNPVSGGQNTATSLKTAAAMECLNFRTTAGGRARITLIGSGAWSPDRVGLQGATGGDGTRAAIVSYVSGPATGLRGHDGAKFVAQAHITSPYNRRLRRRYNLA